MIIKCEARLNSYQLEEKQTDLLQFSKIKDSSLGGIFVTFCMIKLGKLKHRFESWSSLEEPWIT